MTTCLDLINRAFRLAGGLRDTYTALDATDAPIALEELESLLLTLPGATHWTDVEVAADYTAGENERVFNTGASSVTISLPIEVSSARKILWCCNQTVEVCTGYADRYPKDGARVQIAGATPVTYRFCADLGDWLPSSGLALTDLVPLNADLHVHLAAMLAVVLATQDGRQPPAATVSIAQEGERKMRARFGKRQEQAVELALIRTSSNPCTYEG